MKMCEKRKCDRCWKPTPVDELVKVKNKAWILLMCKDCAVEVAGESRGVNICLKEKN